MHAASYMPIHHARRAHLHRAQLFNPTVTAMKILKARAAFLLDYEVLAHLKSLQETYNWSFNSLEDKNFQKKKRFTGAGLGLEVVTRDILLYLGKSASGQISSNNTVVELMNFLNTFELMKIEKLQILNSLPRSMVHLYGLVEECDQRFDEATCESIIEKINELVPLPEVEDEAQGNASVADET